MILKMNFNFNFNYLRIAPLTGTVNAPRHIRM